MSSNLLFDFTVDKATHTILVTKAFNAKLSLVWDAFTKQEIFDQWRAPAPWTAKTKYMKFEVGGYRLYSMTSPQGQEHWSIQEFTSINPTYDFKMRTNFSDKGGNINTEFKSSENNLDFSETNNITTVNISIKYATPAILEMMIERGHKQGFTMTLDNLEKLLTT